MTQVFSSVKDTFSVVEHNFTLSLGSSSGKIATWKSKGLSTEKIVTHDDSLFQTIRGYEHSNCF